MTETLRLERSYNDLWYVTTAIGISYLINQNVHVFHRVYTYNFYQSFVYMSFNVWSFCLEFLSLYIFLNMTWNYSYLVYLMECSSITKFNVNLDRWYGPIGLASFRQKLVFIKIVSVSYEWKLKFIIHVSLLLIAFFATKMDVKFHCNFSIEIRA